MKKIFFGLCLLISFYLTAFAEGEAINASIAKNIIAANSGFEREADPVFVKNALDSLDPAGLEKLRKIIKDDLAQNPRSLILPPESITAAWEAIGIVYNIDKRLGQLEYNRIAEGRLFDGSPGLFGTIQYKFRFKNGQILGEVLVTPGTILENCAGDVDSYNLVRIYIKEPAAARNLHNEVIMIESLRE